jgi:hypothetical protein
MSASISSEVFYQKPKQPLIPEASRGLYHYSFSGVKRSNQGSWVIKGGLEDGGIDKTEVHFRKQSSTTDRTNG